MEANINVVVTGKEQLEELQNSVKGVDNQVAKLSETSTATSKELSTLSEASSSTSQGLNTLDQSTGTSIKSLVGWTAVIGTATYAVNKIVSAGYEYNKNLEEIQGNIVTTTELEDALSQSFGMASGRLLEYTGVWDLYRESLISVSNAIDVVAGKEAIMAQAKADHIVMEAE